jgi:hypothetical protein
MRKLRILAAGAWYLVSTAVNNREPLFWSALERARFKRVLNEARKLHAFALYGLRFSGPTVSFYIKPVDGLQLPEIMQWIKQTYSARNNVMKHLDGHVWGDRYASKVLEGEPPEDAIPAGEPRRGDCGENVGEGRSAEGETGEQIPEARLEKGPPGGDSHRAGGSGGKHWCTAAFSLPRHPLNRLTAKILLEQV